MFSVVCSYDRRQAIQWLVFYQTCANIGQKIPSLIFFFLLKKHVQPVLHEFICNWRIPVVASTIHRRWQRWLRVCAAKFEISNKIRRPTRRCPTPQRQQQAE